MAALYTSHVAIVTGNYVYAYDYREEIRHWEEAREKTKKTL